MFDASTNGGETPARAHNSACAVHVHAMKRNYESGIGMCLFSCGRYGGSGSESYDHSLRTYINIIFNFVNFYRVFVHF